MARSSVRSGWGFILAAVLVGGLAALGPLWLPAPAAGGVGATAAVAVAVWVTMGTTRLQAHEDRAHGLAGEVWVGHNGRLPFVWDLSEPVELGVHPAAAVEGSLRSGVTPFVAREFGSELKRALHQDRFVLLVGESTAGKSRAAYELIRAELPSYRLVAPTRRESAQAAARIAAATSRCVLWLDDLERFLGSGGLAGTAVRSVLDTGKGAPRFIVGTMRSEEYARFSGRAAPGADGAGRDVLRQGWDVLRLAAHIDVPAAGPQRKSRGHVRCKAIPGCHWLYVTRMSTA